MTTTLELEPISDELSSVARSVVWNAWNRATAKDKFNRFRLYRDGLAGIPDVKDGSSDEIEELAKMSVRNVCGVVVDTFLRGLSCVGFRSPASDDDDNGWAWWQKHNLDARQAEVHDAALTYGFSFVSVLPDDEKEPVPATWTPRNVIAEWDDPRVDLFPVSAMLIRDVTTPLLGRGWSVLFIDERLVQPAFIRAKTSKKADEAKSPTADDVIFTDEPWEHGATYGGVPVCPVVRFVNERTAEDRDPRGEVEPLIQAQRAINSVNFDRLVTSRFSAFRQKVVIGWAATAEEVARASAADVWAFPDHPADVKVDSLAASPIGPYDALLREMTEQVALQAGIPLHQATGNLSNVSTETAALAESAHQRKLLLKRESFGESWEQVLRLAVEMSGGDAPDEAAEMVWRETEARSFGAVVDGMVKLAQLDNGVPIEELLDLIPGMTQQRITAVRDAMRRRRLTSQLSALGIAAAAQPDEPPTEG